MALPWEADGGKSTPVTIVTPSSYRSDMPDDWDRVRYEMKDAWGFPRVGDLDERTSWAAEKYRDDFGRWPTAYELSDYGPYTQSLNTLASGFVGMPWMFNVDGTTYTNDPFTGPSRVTDINLGLGPGGIDAALNSGELNNSGFLAPKYQWTMGQFNDIRMSLSPIKQPSGGGGGGGGGAGRAPLAFDRAQLEEEATNRWRGLLLEEPGQGTLDSIVNGYISEANGFWMKEAGRLDYDTYVLNRVRATDRHTFLYDKKPEFQSESEYMGGFRQTVGQFGFNDRAALRETEAGAHSGVGLAGFGERVGRTAEARLANTGSYSQRFAASMAQSGLGRT